MKPSVAWSILLALPLMGHSSVLGFPTCPRCSAFNYQGRLLSAGSPVNGPQDFEFRLYDSAAGMGQVGNAVPMNAVGVVNGLFNVTLNANDQFGVSAFNGSNRWLEVRVNGTTLSPRLEIDGTPYAAFAGKPWESSGSNVFYNGGNVGIGTSTPVDKLDVAGGDSSYFRVNGSWGDLHVNGGNDGRFALVNDSAVAAATLELHTNLGAALKISRDRKIGINTDPSPAAQLIVQPSDGEGINVSTILGSLPLVHATDSSLFSNHGTADCVVGEADNGYGVKGVSQGNDGVLGLAHSNVKSGVWGNNDAVVGGGHGVTGSSANGNGVYGITNSTSLNVAGVRGDAVGNGQVVGVYGNASTGTSAAGVVGVGATGGYFASNGLGANTALWANGLCKVGTLQILGGADLAEPFDVNGDEVQPGMVMVIDPNCPGQLKPCGLAYDRRVAGIISGAGGVATGLSMGHEGTLANGKQPVALSGRVYAYCDAANAPIEPGDLLTTSDTPGHAMRVTDHDCAQGAVIGKAMTSLEKGQRGLVLVLVSLQ